MSKDQNELLMLGSLSPGVDRAFLERLQGCINYRNAHGPTPTPALQHEDGNRFKQMVIGPNHIAFLTKDHQIMRLKFDFKEVKLPPTTSVAEKPPQPPPAASVAAQNSEPQPVPNNAAPASGNSSIANAVAAAASGNNANIVSQFSSATRNAKMRRVMMASRRVGGGAGFARGGVIIDRSRALIPAANIPEDLIAQAQVVLQGKSREVIIRELQRTNLNVNEAVNNLLSREDDDEVLEEFEEAADAYLPEELLSLLDAGLRNPESLIEAEGLSALADSSIMARFAVRRRDNRERPRERVVVETTPNVREMFEFADKLEYWTGDEKLFPPNITGFEKIGAMNGELIALANNGLMYSWQWSNEKGEDVPHHVNATFLGHIDPANQKDRIVDIETCAYRCAVLTSTKKIGSFADEITVGKRVAESMFQELVDFPENEIFESLHVCPTFTAIKTKTSLYWWGIMPFVERRRVFEKTRNKAKKFTSSSSSDIKVNAEVRTKSAPVYAANSIAVNLNTGVPTIGVMMESAWSINETCRFRTYTPAQFDLLKDEVLIKDDKRAINLSMALPLVSVRKRAAPSDEPHPGSSTAAVPHKETAWAIKEVFFIHEESCNDVGIVQIVDGQICGIHFKTYIDEKSKSGDGSEDLKRLRLMRKEELIVVQNGARQPTSPITFERHLQRVLLPVGIRRIISTVIDNSGFRLLVEKKGRLHLLRLTTLGKIASDHVLPMSCSAVCGPFDAKEFPSAKLINYGDPDILVLQDYNGCLIPLIRDATTGYCAPPYIGFTGMKNLALGVQYLNSSMDTTSPVISSAPVEKVANSDTPRSVSKILFVASLFSNAPESFEPVLPSLTQLALYCDVDSMRSAISTLEFLQNKLSKDDFAAFIKKHVVDVYADGNRNLMHAAVMNAFAKTNAHQTNVDAPVQNGSTPIVVDVTPEKPEHAKSEAMDVDVVTKPVSDPVQRQKNAVSIIKLITESSAFRDILPELLHQRDVSGHTPFISAIQNRAYGAAIAIWKQMRLLYSPLNRDDFTAKVYNPLQHYDDSPLFILAYNDTCSFTWTGDEHINQDIFECRTCGLTGSLCCCTECAQTCHRNHDCKLKRTSPTAYCDCWERCPCKALVAGNDDQREYLMIQLLDHTNLIQRPNSRGEHLLLFLVKTVGRQLVEQENFRRRTTRSGGGANANAHAEIPERDLEPPKFAQRALAFCLVRWEAVKSLIAVGLKNHALPNKMSEETLHLVGQHGSTHLDKFIFFLLSKCHQAHLDSLLNTLIITINQAHKVEDESNAYASRFLRGVVRMFAIVTLSNPNTIAQTINSVNAFEEDGYAPKFTNAEDYRPKRESAMVSIVRSMPAIFTERAIKDTRPNHTEMFIAKCRRIFQALGPHAINELLNAADAYLAPVRNGFVNPTVNVATAMGSHDPLEYIERHLMSEQDLSSFLDPANEMKSLRRRRYGSRHNAEDEAAAEAPSARAPAAQADSENSDSDSETEGVSRRFSSQGSLHGQALESLNNVVRNYRRNNSRHANTTADDGLVALAAAAAAAAAGDTTRARPLSTSSEDSSDDSNDDESETDRVFGNLEDFENNEFDDDEEVREEEGDEYYDEEDGEEAPNDFAEDDEGSGNEEDDYDEDASPAAVDENAQPPADEPMDAEPASGAVEIAPAAENVAPEAAAPTMEVYIEQQDAVNAMIEQANDEVAIDIVPGGEAADASVQPGNDAFATFRSSDMTAHRPPPPTSSSRSLTWAVPALRSADTEAANNGDLVIRTTAPSTTADNTTRATTKAENPDDTFASNEKTALQFAAVFAALIRVVDDLLMLLSKYNFMSERGLNGLNNVLEMDYHSVVATRNFVDRRIKVNWNWLCTVMDKVEAQLRFGTALHLTPAAAYLNLEPEKSSEPKKDEKRKYVPKKSGESSTSSGQKKEQHQNRRDFLQYFFSISRSHAHENGDELPIIEYRALRPAALVAEAFLFHASIAEMFESNIERNPSSITGEKDYSGSSESSETTSTISDACFVNGRELDRFFKRPRSLCYPNITFASYHHAFQYLAEECLPLACRSQLLSPDVEKSQLFGMTNPHRTKDEHLLFSRMHGVPDPTFHSLGQYPTLINEVFHGPPHLPSPPSYAVEPNVNHPTYRIDYSYCRVKNRNYIVDDAFTFLNTASHVALYRVLSRWSNTFSLITQMYTDDLVLYSGGDAIYSVTLVETASFHFRQSQFRKRIEKIKNQQLKDLVFSGIVRDKSALILQTFRALNQQYSRRVAAANANSGMGHAMRFIGHREIINETPPPPLAAHKVKVTFKDEPGEGTGVARSFYSAIADALTSLQTMPLEGFEFYEEVDKRQRSTPSSATNPVVALPAKRLTRQILQTMMNAVPPQKRSAFKKAKHVYNLKTPLFSPSSEYNKIKKELMPAIDRAENPGKEKLGDVVFAMIHSYEASFAQRVTGILLDMADDVILEAIKNPDILHLHVIEIIKQLQTEGYINSFDKESTNPLQREDAPFFTRLSGNGHYVPLVSTSSVNRNNGFRNVGRMIGLCLQQREIFPLQLARHVFQFILGQPLTWFDCAFYDPVIFNSMRALIFNEEKNYAHNEDFYQTLCLNFTASTAEGQRFMELISGGEHVDVDRENVLEYFYHYIHSRLLGPNLPALEAIRTGVFDVIPAEVLNGLTPEDFRLLLCGSQEINMTQLESYTKFLDESSSTSDVLEKYKQTFWSVVNKFTSLEKQDLIFFWTGSPTLPANEEEFTPLPTIMIRPSDQNLHLPTANTCISRLYLPLYSSKKILRNKLLLAIKSRNFGFV